MNTIKTNPNTEKLLLFSNQVVNDRGSSYSSTFTLLYVLACVRFLLCSVSPGFEAIKEQNICNKIMAELIQNYSNIFDSSPDGDQDGLTGHLPTLIIVKVHIPSCSPSPFYLYSPQSRLQSERDLMSITFY